MMDKSPEIGATYLPMEFRQALARGQSLPESAHGAALFSDFSGFTVLAGALAEKHGKTRGAERLAELLRGAFDGIISAIHDYRGSVIGFSGDAVTVWFDDDADTEAPGAVRAVAAAIAMREFVAALPAFRLDETQSLSIAIKVSVSSGPAQRYVVGDPKLQRMAVFAGDTLQRLALADNIAEAGDLILDLDSYDRCAQLLHVAKENPAKKVDGFVSLEDCSMDLQRCPWPSYASLKIEDIRSWLLAEMAESATTGASESLGAFKPIVAVFLKFEGIDYDDDPNAGYQLNTLISRVQQIAADYGGHLVDVTIGDKGSYVFLAFGALKTHEDDAARAIAAVVELRRAGTGVQQLKDAAIGVARGSVYVGEYGGKERRTYGIVGRDIIVAARLMSLADPEQTLVTSHVVDLTKSQFRFDEYAVVDLKGIGEPMTAYTFDALGDSKASSPISSLSTDRLVGREHECGIIDAAIASAEEQTAEMLIIEGEPGIGKSRVLEYLLQKGTRLGKRILVGAADAIGSTSRYHAWNAIFSELMSLPRSQASEQRADVACAYLDENLPHLAQLAPLLSDVIGAQINDNELTRNMTGQVREDNTIDLLTQVLAAYVRHEPVIIVLEDAHWFDSASAALLLRSGEELKNALIVVTRRPISEEFSANAIYSLDQSRAQVMRLGPLSPEAVEELIGDVLQVDNVPPELHDFVVEKAHGSPFFSRELTIALLEANNILVDNKHCKLVNGLSGLEQADFPFTIQGAIGSRIDNLPALQQQVMKVGSVVGREFGYKIVNDLLPSDDDRSELQDSLAQLNKADLIEVVGGLSERKYVFRHVLTQEVAYSMLLHRQRTALHERAARWYEDLGETVDEQLLPLLAHHWSRAALERPGDEYLSGKAVGYLGVAAEQGIAGNANREATKFINDALAIDNELHREARTEPLQRARWFATLAHAYHALGDEAQCRVAVETGLTCANAPLPKSNLKLAVATIRQVLRQAVHRLSRLDINKKTMPPGRRETALAQCILYRNLARALWGSNESMLMLYANFRNLNLSERLGASPELGVIYSHMVMTMGVFQLPKWGSWYRSQSLAVCRETGDMSALATVLVGLGVNAVGTGDWRTAIEILEECQELCSRLGDTKQWAEAASLLGDAALLTGDIDRGLACYLDVYGRAERKGSLGHMGLSLRTQAIVALQKGDLVKARQLLIKAEDVLSETTEKLIQIDVTGLRAQVELESGDSVQSCDYLNRAIKLIGETMPPIAYPRIFGLRSTSKTVFELIESCGTTADTSMHQELKVQADTMYRHLKAYQRVFAIGEPIARIHGAKLLRMRGRAAAASKELDKAIAAAHRLQMKPDLEEAKKLADKITFEKND